MKKVFITLLIFSMFVNFSFAESIARDDILIILSGMEIIDSNLELDGSITRKELAEILVKASTNANLVDATNRISVFSDVPYNFEGAGYIRLAALNGYLTAYSDGEFKPLNIVKNEEAVTATLKLLGYTNKDFTQSYPYEQLSIAKDIGLTDGVDTTIGSNITRENLYRLIYNALSCETKTSGKKYIETLGYNLTSSKVTLGDVMSKNVEGPVTYASQGIYDLTNLSNPNVYINGDKKDVDDIEQYDVLYYSRNSNTIWAYRDKVTGMVEEILPNKEAPTSVTISGKTYKLSTYSAQKAFGVSGISLGNMVTVLLDRNSEISDVYKTEDLYSEQVGVILSSGKKEKMQTDGNTKVTYYATVLLSTGETIDVSTNTNYSKKVGYTAKVSYKNGKVSIYSTSKTTDISGKFDFASKTIGSKNKISDEIKIIEVDEFGNTEKIYSNRLDGVYLGKEDVALVTKNSKGEIESMILKDVTGDTAKYGILENINERQDSESYSCIVNGNSVSYSNSDVSFSVDKGPVQIYLDGQTLGKIKNLEKVEGSIINVNNSYVENSKGEKIKVSNDVVVYVRVNSEYNLSTMEEALSGEYNVSAYYDKELEKGGRVRVIIIS